jgi:hypothetical protein
MGRMRAGRPDSLWCECHRPGGVTKAAPGSQSTRMGPTMAPVGAGAAYALAGGYEPVLWGMATVSLFAVAAMVGVGRQGRHGW